MSKSLGNFFTVREAAQAYGYEAIRMFMLMAHYRSPLNYSEDSLLQAKAALQRLYTADENLEFLSSNSSVTELTDDEADYLKTLDTFKERFIQVMDDDLNTADAVSVIFEMVRSINVKTEKNPSREMAAECRKRLRELTDVLGLLYSQSASDNLTSEIEALIEARQKARKAKDFAEADRIRDKLKEMGILLEDTPQGVKWKRA